MRLEKSEFINRWYGFYTKDEFGHLEEFYTVRTLKAAEKIIERLKKDLKELKGEINVKKRRYKRKSRKSMG